MLTGIPSILLLTEPLRMSGECFLPGGRHTATGTRSSSRDPFLGTKLQLQVVSLRFLAPDVAVCETLTWVSGFKSGAPPDLHLDTKGRLRTRLLQVMEKRGGEWQIVVYLNLDIKPDVETPEPK